MKETKAKKLMILGCGPAQLDLILESKKAGYTTIACDMRPEMEGARIADRFYQLDYMDLERVCAIAEKEHIDGIISNSEPAMVHVAYVAQKMGLIGNSVESVESLSSKTKFRALQRKAGVFVPEHFSASSFEEFRERAKAMQYPVIIKPAMSTGTQGTTKLNEYDAEALRKIFCVCQSLSRNGQVSVEQYVPMPSLWVSESDVVVIGDDIIWDGMMWTRRSGRTPMLPETYVFPMDLPGEKKTKIQDTVGKILKTAGIKHGQYNVEAYLTEEDEVFVIEINPRQGGNHITQLVEEHSGVNLSKLIVSTAVRDMTYYNELKTFVRQNNYVTLHVAYAREDGVLAGIYVSPEIEPFVRWSEQRIPNGAEIRKGTTVFDGIACFDLHFNSYEAQRFYTSEIEKYIHPIIRH